MLRHLAIPAALAAAVGCSPQPTEPAEAVDPGDKLDPVLTESTAAFWQGCDERFAEFATEREIELDAGRIGVHGTARSAADVAPLKARVEALGGTVLSDIGPHFYAWLSIPALLELGQSEAVVRLEWNRAEIEPFAEAAAPAAAGGER